MPDSGVILRVDLGTGLISREGIGEDLRRKFLGGEGINSLLLWQHFLQVDPRIDPLSSENVLVAGTGPLAATGFGAGSKSKFTYKSPAYNIFGDTSVGGQLGSQLRWAGYDHVVITGRAEYPVYLYIHDDDVQIRDARHLWGTTVSEADAKIRHELGDDETEMACIGQAGENLVRVASIMVSRHRAGGRGGGGCVMGSKNLKAIAGRGTKGVRIHNPSALLRAADEFFALAAKNRRIERHMRFGTLTNVKGAAATGTYRNGQGRLIPEGDAAKLDNRWYRDNLGVRSYACSPGCRFGCGHWHYVKGDETPAARTYNSQWGTRPEFGSLHPFGVACDCADMAAVIHCNALCNEFGMDVMEIGMSLSFLMELWERGIITEDDTRRWTGERLTLEWGNHEAMARLIEATALRKNELGEMLGGGVYQAALRIGEQKGVDVLSYANYGKGGATHEAPVRAVPALAIASAVVSIGAHHCKGLGLNPASAIRYFGRPEPGEGFSTLLKGTAHAISENLVAIVNSVGICSMLSGSVNDFLPLELTAETLEAATGLALSPDELFMAGERVVNIQKAFNSRLGLRREHDALCKRWLNEPQLEGIAKGAKAGDYLEAAKDEYYQRRGWEVATALQTKEKLADLDLGDVAEVLAKEGALAAVSVPWR